MAEDKKVRFFEVPREALLEYLQDAKESLRDELTEHIRKIESRSRKFDTPLPENIDISRWKDQIDVHYFKSGTKGQFFKGVDPQLGSEIERRKLRIERFGDTTTEDIPTEHWEESKKVSDEIEIRLDALHLYGVDFMSSRDIRFYFKDYEVQLEWINDSACNVVFDNEDFATSALELVTVALEDDDTAAVNPWRRGIDFITPEGRKHGLKIRYATVLDIKDGETKGQNSKYYMYLKQTKNPGVKRHIRKQNAEAPLGELKSKFEKKIIRIKRERRSDRLEELGTREVRSRAEGGEAEEQDDDLSGEPKQVVLHSGQESHGILKDETEEMDAEYTTLDNYQDQQQEAVEDNPIEEQVVAEGNFETGGEVDVEAEDQDQGQEQA